jgi:hypothetical protein
VERDEPGPAADGAEGGEDGGTGIAGGSCEDGDAAGVSFVEIEWARGFAKSACLRANEFGFSVRWARQGSYGNHANGSGCGCGASGEETHFGCGDGEGVVGDDGMKVDFSGVRVHTGWKIDGGDGGTVMIPEIGHFPGEGDKGFTKGAGCSDAEKAV